jgi:hypothetical protein
MQICGFAMPATSVREAATRTLQHKESVHEGFQMQIVADAFESANVPLQQKIEWAAEIPKKDSGLEYFPFREYPTRGSVNDSVSGSSLAKPEGSTASWMRNKLDS